MGVYNDDDDDDDELRVFWRSMPSQYLKPQRQLWRRWRWQKRWQQQYQKSIMQWQIIYCNSTPSALAHKQKYSVRVLWSKSYASGVQHDREQYNILLCFSNPNVIIIAWLQRSHLNVTPCSAFIFSFRAFHGSLTQYSPPEATHFCKYNCLFVYQSL